MGMYPQPGGIRIEEREYLSELAPEYILALGEIGNDGAR